METHFNGQPNPEELEAGQGANQTNETSVADQLQASSDAQEQKKRVRHEDHHVNRKYRLFSNHSSYGDSPHTNTSF